jgi:hypothetical protein
MAILLLPNISLELAPWCFNSLLLLPNLFLHVTKKLPKCAASQEFFLLI